MNNTFNGEMGSSDSLCETDKNSRRLLVLGGPIFQRPIIDKAKQMGLLVAVVDIDEDAPCALFGDVFYKGSIKDRSIVAKIARDFQPDAVISGACDTSVGVAAYLCRSLGLPGNSESAAYNSTDKVAMLESFKQNGVAHPLYQVVSKADLGGFELFLPYPVIVKPTDSAGGRGVNLVLSEEGLREAVEISSRAGASGDVLIEEYMEGPEVSVEIIVADRVPHVLQITDKVTSGAPNFFEIGHVQPSALSSDTKAMIADLASRAVLAVGLVNSAAHVEIKVTEDGPKMIELGARMGGDCITTYLVGNSVEGIDMAETMIRLALGERIDEWSYRDSGEHIAVKFLPSVAGVLQEISGIDDMLKVPGVIHAEIMGVAGETYSDAVDDSSRFAFVVARGSSNEDALAVCDDALSKIRLTMG